MENGKGGQVTPKTWDTKKHWMFGLSLVSGRNTREGVGKTVERATRRTRGVRYRFSRYEQRLDGVTG